MANLLETISKEQVQHESDIVTSRLLGSDWYKKSQRISVYVSTNGEIQTDSFIKHAMEMGKDVFIPRFKKGAHMMEMLKLESLEEFQTLDTSLWGIRQHHPDLMRPMYYDSGPLDLVLLPGVAFTEKGHRLGHGKGFYDKFLTDHHERFGCMPTMVGLALKVQMVEDLPVHQYDVTIDHVLHI
uniref:5-formyltetrahydrofolate cyclo-ligase n=1 Tax=Acrobeloides nanus TaxID=290746 RepID=A0A914E7E1_9BILA